MAENSTLKSNTGQGDGGHGSGTIAPPPTRDQEAPDPDEDDLDDLDDVLDEFASTSIHQKADAPVSSGPGRPSAMPSSTKSAEAGGHSSSAEQDAFRDALQKEMAALMGDMDESPEVRKQFEAMLQSINQETARDGPDIHEGITTTSSKPTNTKVSDNTTISSSTAPIAEDSFQETIRKTMERMSESSASASAATAEASGGQPDDMIAQMLKDLQAEGGGEEDFSKMLLSMMEQLTNKEILYEPMKELYDKFPAWMEKEGPKCNKEDLERYKEQQSLVSEIVARFERPGYKDENTEDREFIVERMQKMQAAGSPPSDLVGDMKEAQEVFGEMEGGCPTQ